MLTLHYHCAHRQVRTRTRTRILHPHKHLTGFGWAEFTVSSGVLHPLPLGCLIPRLSSSPHIQLSAWHWAECSGSTEPYPTTWSVLPTRFFAFSKEFDGFIPSWNVTNHRTIYSGLRTSHKNVYKNPAEYFTLTFAVTWGRLTCHSVSRSFAPPNNSFFLTRSLDFLPLHGFLAIPKCFLSNILHSEVFFLDCFSQQFRSK